MTKEEREVMRMALEALEDLGMKHFESTNEVLYKETFTAIKEALAQPEQEPVAWMFQHEETGRMMFVEAQQLEWGFEKGNPRLKKIGPLYTTPPQRKPLTDEEIERIYNRYGGEMINCARAIERAHGIKGEA